MIEQQSGLTINWLLEANVLRSGRFGKDSLEGWSVLEWAGAMCGEAGEAANAAVKLRRIECAKQSAGQVFTMALSEDVATAKKAVANEIADTIIYAVLLAARIGVVDLETVIKRVFNKKSVEWGLPDRL